MIERTKVVVVWHDAHSLGDEWMELRDIDASPLVVETLGWLLPDAKKDHVVVAQSITNEDGIDSIMCVPVGMVQSVRVL